MRKWSISFTAEANKDLDKIDQKLRTRIFDKLNWFEANFNDIIPSSLGAQWQGCFKIRVGDWRIIYKIDWSNNLIVVYIIDRRDKIYKTRKI